jgi:hypothetical protein
MIKIGQYSTTEASASHIEPVAVIYVSINGYRVANELLQY